MRRGPCRRTRHRGASARPVLGRWNVTVRSAWTDGIGRFAAREVHRRRGVDGHDRDARGPRRRDDARPPSGSARAGRRGRRSRAAHRRRPPPSSMSLPNIATSRATGSVDLGDAGVARDPIPVPRGRGAPLGRCRSRRRATITCAPASARRRAATKPSPPLLPGPHRITIGPVPHRSEVRRRAPGPPPRPRSRRAPSGGPAGSRAPAPVGRRRSSPRPRSAGRAALRGPAAAQAAQVHLEDARVVGRQRREPRRVEGRRTVAGIAPKRSRRRGIDAPVAGAAPVASGFDT